MLSLNNLANTITNATPPSGVLNFFQKTAQEGQVALVVPETSVIAGRSVAGAQRGGFLEFQERIIEETVVAVIWLWGVKAFKNILNKYVGDKFGVDTSISWRNVLKKAGNTVALHPDEMMATGAESMSKLVKYKAGVTGVSVGATLGIVALLIPWLNQKKTEWILNNTKYGQPQHGQADAVPATAQAATNAPQVNSLGAKHFAGNTATPALQPAQNAFSQFSGSPLPKAPAGNHPKFDGGDPTSPFARSLNIAPGAGITNARQPQFGGMGQMLGYAINHTPYGEILAVDTGITGGRAVVAANRSPFEAAEIVFRDGLSLYFYIMSAPHLMKLMSKLLDKPFGSSLLLDPKMAAEVSRELTQRLPANEKLTFEALQTLVNGSRESALKEAAPILERLMKTATLSGAGESATRFEELVKTENRLFDRQFSSNAAKADDTAEKALAYLKSLQAGKVSASTDDIARLLHTIKEGVGPFSTLNSAEKANLSLAVKNAFRHSAGVALNGFDEATIRQAAPQLEAVLDKLPEGERKALIERLGATARRDGLDLGTGMFRRAQVLYSQALGADHELVKQANDVIDWMGKAVRRNVNLRELILEEGEEVATDLEKQLKGVQNDPQLRQAIAKLRQGDLSGLDQLQNKLKKSGGRARRTKNWLMGVETLESRVQGLQSISAHASDKSTPELAEKSVLSLLGKLEDAAKNADNSKLMGEAGEMLESLGQKIRALIPGKQGHLMTLFTEQGQAQSDAKLAETLYGGLKHDSRLLSWGLRQKGQLVDTLKLYANQGKQKEMGELVEKYLDAALEKFEKTEVETAQKLLSPTQVTKFFGNFQKLSKNLYVGASAVALGGTMLGLGVLVPKLQYALTKKLTGKNEHPGIAKVSHHGEAPAGQPSGAAAAPPLPSALTRNNFANFRRATS